MMKQIGCLLCIAALLALAVGCGKQSCIRSQESVGFFVDGIQCHVYWNANVVQQEEQVFLTFMTLSRTPVTISTVHGDTVVSTLFPDGEKIIAKTETVYFIHDNKIVFEKEYRELGIDVSKLNVRNSKVLQDYLQPILERLIRENVPPQEPDTE